MMFSHARPTGFPVGGWYAISTQGDIMRQPYAQHGDMAPRYASPEAAAKGGAAIERLYDRLLGLNHRVPKTRES
jgi:hypothetical protein